jgi:hypothetical protein
LIDNQVDWLDEKGQLSVQIANNSAVWSLLPEVFYAPLQEARDIVGATVTDLPIGSRTCG